MCEKSQRLTKRQKMSLLPLKGDIPKFLEPYLPQRVDGSYGRPFVTLTYAQSLDSRISKGHGLRTTISHPETKTMTHYLRYHHDGILVGSGTALADDPGLNCKYGGTRCYEHSPRPIVLNGQQRWKFEGSKIQELFLNNQGQAPIVVVSEEPSVKEEHVTYLVCPYNDSLKVDWRTLLEKLYHEFNIHSVMVEGGAVVINELLLRGDLVDSLIITIGSTFLGEAGVEVSPSHSIQLREVNWWRGTTDAVMSAMLCKSGNDNFV